MNKKKIIAVIGATGAQGGGLVQAILDDPNSEFAARAITRDAKSDKAKALATSGAEVVEADVDDPESLRKAFDGAYGVFCVTFFWEHFSPDKEMTHAKNMADAAEAAGVKHVIWSSLEDTRKLVPLDDDRMPTLMEKFKVPHFDAKGDANKFFKGRAFQSTILLTSFYWDNFIYFGMGPKKGEDGKYAISFPMSNKKLPGIAARDIGKCAFGIFKSDDKYSNKTVGIAGEHLTGEEMANAFSKALGKSVVYQDVPPEVYRSFGFPGADDLGNMFQFKRDFEKQFCGVRKLDESKSLNPDLLSFTRWLDQNKARIPME
jgi:uncharacterized protein YbjT (DUF2867 family)